MGLMQAAGLSPEESLPTTERAGMYKRAFRILFLCLVCIGMGQSMLFTILPPAAREIGLSPFQVSTIFATSATLWVFVSPRWGRLSDVMGRRPIILIGLLGFALSMVLLATMIEIGLRRLLPLALVYPLMVVSRCVFALFGSGTGPASQAYVADRTSRTERTAGVALVNAALGLGQTIGPAAGAVLAAAGLLAPVYFSAALAVCSAAMIWWRLPEDGPPIAHGEPRPPRMRVRDVRIIPFIIIAAALQGVTASMTITLAFFLQDMLRLNAQQTVQQSGIGFVVFAIAGLFAQLVVVQRLRPTARTMIRVGLPLMLISFLVLVAGRRFDLYLMALALLGFGAGLVRPGNAAAASLAVEPNEQGAVAGLLGGIGTVGNIFAPMLGTSLYGLMPAAPYLLNSAIMVAILIFIVANPRLRHLRV